MGHGGLRLRGQQLVDRLGEAGLLRRGAGRRGRARAYVRRAARRCRPCSGRSGPSSAGRRRGPGADRGSRSTRRRPALPRSDEPTASTVAACAARESSIAAASTEPGKTDTEGSAGWGDALPVGASAVGAPGSEPGAWGDVGPPGALQAASPRGPTDPMAPAVASRNVRRDHRPDGSAEVTRRTYPEHRAGPCFWPDGRSRRPRRVENGVPPGARTGPDAAAESRTACRRAPVAEPGAGRLCGVRHAR